MAKRLTEHSVRSAQPKTNRYTISEDGLTLEVHPTGRKVLYAKYRQDGKQHKEWLGEYPALSLRDARDTVKDLQLKVSRQSAPVYQSTVTLNEFIEGRFKEWVEGNRSDHKGTMTRLRMVMREAPALAKTKLRDVTREQVENYQSFKLQQGAKGRKPDYVNRLIGDIKRVFSLATEYSYIRMDPAKPVKSLTVDTDAKILYLSEKELGRLEEAIAWWHFQCSMNLFNNHNDRVKYPAWFPLFVRLALNTGARKGELLQLRWCDVDIDERKITLRGTTTKNKKTRRVPVNNDLLEDLNDAQSSRVIGYEVNENDQLVEVAVSETNNIFPIRDVRKPWKTLQTMAKLPHVTPHHLRHHAASMMVKMEASIYVVKEILGHSSIAVTAQYLSAKTDDKMEALNLLNRRS